MSNKLSVPFRKIYFMQLLGYGFGILILSWYMYFNLDKHFVNPAPIRWLPWFGFIVSSIFLFATVSFMFRRFGLIVSDDIIRVNNKLRAYELEISMIKGVSISNSGGDIMIELYEILDSNKKLEVISTKNLQITSLKLNEFLTKLTSEK